MVNYMVRDGWGGVVFCMNSRMDGASDGAGRDAIMQIAGQYRWRK